MSSEGQGKKDPSLYKAVPSSKGAQNPKYEKCVVALHIEKGAGGGGLEIQAWGATRGLMSQIEAGV